MGYRCDGRWPADSSEKDTGRWHCHDGIQSSTKQNHISGYSSVDPEFNRLRTKFEYLLCAKNILDSGDILMKKPQKSLPSWRLKFTAGMHK